MPHLSPRITLSCKLIALFALLAQALMLALPPSTLVLPAHTSMLSVHLLLELFAIITAALIATVTWHTFDNERDQSRAVLIGGFLLVGCCDIVHAITYEGMAPFLGEASTPRAIFFWLMGRSAEVLTLGMIAWRLLPGLTRNSSLFLGLLASLAIVAWGSWALDWFPNTFVPGQGVTVFKTSYEWALCALNLLIAWRLWQLARRGGRDEHVMLATSAFVIGVGELSFTHYLHPSDFQNLFGHAYKIAGYGLLYWSTYQSSLRAPFDTARAAEQRAQDSERRIRSISNNLPEVLVYQKVRDADGREYFSHVSDTVEHLIGLSAGDILARPELLTDRLNPEDQALLRAAQDRSAQTLDVYDLTLRLRHADGRVRWMRLAGAPRRLPDGSTCWDSIATDITDSRAASEQLHESEAVLAAVIRSASDAVISTDAQGVIRLFNPAAERIFGHTAQAMLGQPLDALLPAVTRPAHRQFLQNYAASGVASRRMGAGRVRGLRADGTELELEASISQVTVNEHQVLTAILRDVTERVRTERALLQYQLELTELTHRLIAQEKLTSSRLAQVLHDQLGQTLTAMRIDFVSDATLPSPTDTERHARVDRLIDQAIREVRQVLVELRPTLLDEHGLVEALDNELRSRRQAARGVQLQLEVAPALAGRRWSSDVEYAAFMVAREALSNALTHAGATTICVRLEGDAHWLRLEIADDGSGMPVGASAVRPGHLGMVGMRERSIAIGGQFEVGSTPGGGTTVILNWEDSKE